jgi:hypothetical protein
MRVNLQDVLNQAKQLSPVDKVRLIQQLAFDLESELRDRPATPQYNPQQPPHQPPQQPPQQPNWDMSGGDAMAAQRPAAPDIDPARWDDWASFPD